MKVSWKWIWVDQNIWELNWKGDKDDDLFGLSIVRDEMQQKAIYRQLCPIFGNKMFTGNKKYMPNKAKTEMGTHVSI